MLKLVEHPHPPKKPLGSIGKRRIKCWNSVTLWVYDHTRHAWQQFRAKRGPMTLRDAGLAPIVSFKKRKKNNKVSNSWSYSRCMNANTKETRNYDAYGMGDIINRFVWKNKPAKWLNIHRFSIIVRRLLYWMLFERFMVCKVKLPNYRYRCIV